MISRFVISVPLKTVPQSNDTVFNILDKHNYYLFLGLLLNIPSQKLLPLSYMFILNLILIVMC